jgi:7-cyano-7-deazaguanine synthase
VTETKAKTKTTSSSESVAPRGALVVLSGGIDSTACLAMALDKWNSTTGPAPVAALSFHYQQKHTSKELKAAKQVADYFGVAHRILDLTTGIGGLTDPRVRIPNVDYKDIEGVSPTYVPFRNGLMIAQAASIAAGLHYAEVYFGAHADDASGDAYPDCTLEFIGAMAAAVHRGTYGRLQLKAPLINMQKHEGIRAAEDLGLIMTIPWWLTWSCYHGDDVHCGTCPTCRARKEAFIKSAVTDPTEYAS